MRFREQAICLKTTDYSETSQIVHFLTRGGGVVRLLAKGAKRPKSKSQGAIDLLAEGDLVGMTGGGEALGTLVEFAETTPHPALRKSARRLNTALYMLELTGLMLAEADPHPEVFDLLHKTLARLEQPDAPTAAVLAYFQWRLLKLAGLLGDLTKCIGCGETLITPPGAAAIKPARAIHFSSRQGGLLCAACEGHAVEKIRLDLPTLAGLAALLAVSAGKKIPLPEDAAGAANRLLAYHVSHQLARPLKMARHAIT